MDCLVGLYLDASRRAWKVVGRVGEDSLVIALAGWVWTEIEDFMASHAMAKKFGVGKQKCT